MRSYLFVPADDERKIEKSLLSEADALIFDLEDAVSVARKAVARDILAKNLQGLSASKVIFIRVNALDTGLTDNDLSAVVSLAPYGLVLPKCRGGHDVAHLSVKLNVHEARAGLAEGAVKILAIGTETAQSVFGLGTYQHASKRLMGLTWGAEDLMADLGAEQNRDAEGRYTEPFRLARTLCLLGAAAAGIEAVDAVYPQFRDLDGLRAECLEARRDGFTSKMAIHPQQIPVIHETFTPDDKAIEEARNIIAAFDQAPSAGVVSFEGRMLDKPHLRAAERLLGRVR